MWIYTVRGYYGVVAGRFPGSLTVRSRVAGDLQALLPKSVVHETNDRDYRFRTTASRARVIAALSDAIEGIEYQNFKAEIPTQRAGWYTLVWRTMCMMQAALLEAENAHTENSLEDGS